MANGYHLFSTGEVLTAANVNDYLMKQTVMIFASASARTTALSGVLREGMLSYRLDAHVLEVYNGTIWEAPETNLTTKGDLATFDTAPTRLAVGSDGQTLVANSSASTGLSYQPLNSAGKNAIINGGFDIWQRGTSFTSTASTKFYTADRWMGYCADTNMTVTQVASGLTGFNYASRITRLTGQVATDYLYYSTTIETLNSIPFAGQTVTLSFWARKGTGYDASGSLLGVSAVYGTGTNENALAPGFTGSTSIISTNATLQTTWQKFTYTGTVGTTATEIGLNFTFVPNGTAVASDYFDITGVQLELGSVATNFSRAGGTYQGELQACQRYYFRQGGLALYQIIGGGTAESSTKCEIQIPLPVTMRTISTDISWSTLALQPYGGGTVYAVTNIYGGISSPSLASIGFNVASGLTQGQWYRSYTNNSLSGFVAINSEL